MLNQRLKPQGLALLLLFCSMKMVAAPSPGISTDSSRIATLIIMFDGLRPDYITPELMPRLFAFSKEAAYGQNHYSVYPTVTRVNAASYATGSYPAVHGLMENSVYLPDLEVSRVFNTGNVKDLQELETRTNGQLLTTTSLGEILHDAGEQLFVYSSGTTGQAFLQNHKVKGAIINPDCILPESMKAAIIQRLGDPPADATPNKARHQWVVDALLFNSIKKQGPLVSAIWLSDPDGTAHKHGIGIPIMKESLKIVDTEFGRIMDSMKARGLENQFNIMISADHGFISYKNGKSIADFLIAQKIKESKTSQDVVIAGSCIYVQQRNPEKIKAIVEALQQQDWAGAIFTRAAKKGSDQGWVPGTLSFDAINWNHDQRGGDIVVAPNWNDDTNEYGYAGMARSGGPAGHGGSSKWEMHIAFLAKGPSFKPATQSIIPSSNIDMIPTLLSIYKLPVPKEMQGRVMKELMSGNTSGKVKSSVKTKRIETSTKVGNIKYKVILEASIYNNARYINYIQATRQ